MAKTDKATEGKRASTLANLKAKVIDRNEKYAQYLKMLDEVYTGPNARNKFPKKIDKAPYKAIHKDIKKLEDEIQSNIKRNYADPTKTAAYDSYFEQNGRPTRNLPPRKQMIETKAGYDALKETKQYKFPEVPNQQDPQPTGEGEVADSKKGFGRKGGKVVPLEETKASMRGAAKKKGKAKEEMELDPRGDATEPRDTANDVARSREMPESTISRIKGVLNYMKDFKPEEHEMLVSRTGELVLSNPEYMDYSQEDRDRLVLYYTEQAFNRFPLQFRNDVIDEVDAASNIAENVKKSEGSASTDPPPAEERKNPLLRGDRRRGATDDTPQREGDEAKIKSGDSNNKANAEPGAATTGAEKNSNAEQSTPFTEQATTVPTPGGTVESTDPDSGTKFEGQEGELDIPFAGGGGVGAGAFKSDVLSQLEPQSEVASKLAEDKKRRRKDVERLIKEINCFHLVYDDYIPLFRSKEHNKAKDDAIASKDRDKLIKHHLMMSNTIRQYYKTADLRVGVIMSAESMFGQSVSNLITGHMQSGGAALPNAIGINKFLPGTTGGPRFIPKGSDPVKGAIAGNVNIRRGGRNTKRPVARFVPKSGGSAEPTDIPEVTPVVDAPMPYVFQTGVRSRRQYRDPQLKLKVKK